jgi:hypothetical protein
LDALRSFQHHGNGKLLQELLQYFVFAILFSIILFVNKDNEDAYWMNTASAHLLPFRRCQRNEHCVRSQALGAALLRPLRRSPVDQEAFGRTADDHLRAQAVPDVVLPDQGSGRAILECSPTRRCIHA